MTTTGIGGPDPGPGVGIPGTGASDARTGAPSVPRGGFDLRPAPQLRARKPVTVWVPAPPTAQTVSALLAMVSAALLALIASLVLVSPIQHYASQTALYDQLRLELAEGAAPVGPVTSTGELVAPGTPIAVLEAADIGLQRGREVIVEGSAGAQTMIGIGHRRDTVLPCQLGASVIMARAGAYGGVGSLLATMTPGYRFSVTTGQGTCTYSVLGQRRVGDPTPAALEPGSGRLTINTALGLPFMPTEVLRIDAELEGVGFDRPATALAAASLPSSEAAMGTDPSNLFALVLLLQLLVAAAIGLTWLWKRWGRWQTWIVGVPVLGAIGLLTSTAINQWLLPNLL